MKGPMFKPGSARLGIGGILFAAIPLIVVLPMGAQNRTELKTGGFLSRSSKPAAEAQQSNGGVGASHEGEIPAGTILPVVLCTSFSFDKSKPGQILHGTIARDVPLPSGTVIRKDSALGGHILEVTRATTGNGEKVSIQFDRLSLAGRQIPVVSNLEAIADCPEALWTLSDAARGTYGIDHLMIAHYGRTAPVGTIVLESETRTAKLRTGDGLLLRTQSDSRDSSHQGRS